MFNINKNSKILVTGGSGLVGKNLINYLFEIGYKSILYPSSKEVDFTNFNIADQYFKKHLPECVFSLAALVGGIYDNKLRPADFYWINSQIGNITFHLSQKYKVKKLICAGAGCGYPLNIKEPLEEKDIWNGLPQLESAAYSTAKKTLITQSEAYSKQYNLNSSVIIPSNLYGEFDNFNLDKSHVIPALIHKFYIAQRNNKKVKVWGDGSSKRDFLYISDFVSALEHSMHLNGSNVINVASGKQFSIRNVCDLLNEITGGGCKIEYDIKMPSGQKSREFSLQKSKLVLPNWTCKHNLKTGLENTYKWFVDNYSLNKVRV
tara:strand:- start:3169 stop:4125 length:957 start_codon:yes stop_codon:yes gene_type:complete